MEPGPISNPEGDAEFMALVGLFELQFASDIARLKCCQFDPDRSVIQYAQGAEITEEDLDKFLNFLSALVKHKGKKTLE